MFRIGFGYDVHQLVPNRPLILGGIVVPHSLGLLGHSDADVLTHAIMDALLGALALGTIGDHFPDTDPAYKDADSLVLLKQVCKLIYDRDYLISNIDSVIVAQKPKLAPHIPKMVETLSAIMEISPSQLSIKATTSETLGPEGREEGMSSHATVLVYPK